MTGNTTNVSSIITSISQNWYEQHVGIPDGSHNMLGFQMKEQHVGIPDVRGPRNLLK
jgi:hypothetical protein